MAMGDLVKGALYLSAVLKFTLPHEEGKWYTRTRRHGGGAGDAARP